MFFVSYLHFLLVSADKTQFRTFCKRLRINNQLVHLLTISRCPVLCTQFPKMPHEFKSMRH